MDKKRTEQLAAETLLERGVRVKLPAPRFFQALGRKTISLIVKQPYLGTMLHLSRLCLKAEFNLDEVDEGKPEAAHRLMRDHGKTVARMVAVTILNSRVKIKLFSGIMSTYLLWHMKPNDLVKTAALIVTLSGIQDFTNTIRLVRSMTMTRPRNLSPEVQGSQEEKQEASIAPGEPSGA